MVKSQNLREKMCEDINAFSVKFGLPQLEKPGFLDVKDMEYRVRFIEEEFHELMKSYGDHNLEGALDALTDMMYVILGTAWMMNLPIMDAWDRVHHTNMQKERATDANDPRSKRKHHLDIVKPEGWIAPHFEDLLR